MVATRHRVVVMDTNSTATVTLIDTRMRRELRSIEFVLMADTFIFVARGEITYRYNGRPGRLIENTLVAIPPGFRVSSLSAEREMYAVTVRDERVTAQNQRDFTPFFQRRLSAADGSIVRAAIQCAAERTAHGTSGSDDVAILKKALSPFHWRHSRDAAKSPLADLFESLWSRLGGPLAIAQLAAEAGYTPNYLSDLVRKHTGRSAGALVADMRMARARALLEQTDDPIAVVGGRCGYDDPAYFARTFQRMHGVSPLAWRLAARPNDARYSGMALAFEAFFDRDSAHLSGQHTGA
jgi:AraC-like DNA-binding protein